MKGLKQFAKRKAELESVLVDVLDYLVTDRYPDSVSYWYDITPDGIQISFEEKSPEDDYLIPFYDLERILPDAARQKLSTMFSVWEGRELKDDTPQVAHEDLDIDLERVTHRGHRIGEDLTRQDLVDLWAYFTLNKDSSMAQWWQDKAHQVGYRIVCRLLRNWED